MLLHNLYHISVVYIHSYISFHSYYLYIYVNQLNIQALVPGIFFASCHYHIYYDVIMMSLTFYIHTRVRRKSALLTFLSMLL